PALKRDPGRDGHPGPGGSEGISARQAADFDLQIWKRESLAPRAGFFAHLGQHRKPGVEPRNETPI
ncbi:MAG: hypothetical protein J2P49_04155, partial [Methylocapsa sp.]|nr:hypothetical protein [Methylocapsa sp.]